MDLSLVIPIYNETKRLSRGLKLALNYLKSQQFTWEIVVVDDGSTDIRTSVTNTEVKIIRTARNFGKGHAIRVGIDAAVGDYIVFSDIDFSVPITYLPQFLSALKKSDMAIGSRRLSESWIIKHQSLLRESLGRGFTRLSNLLLGLNQTDFTCGFEIFRRQSAKALFSRQHLNGWAFDSEILLLAKKLNYRVTEIPVSWHNDPHTKVKLIKDLFASLLSLVYIRLIHR